MKEEEFNKKLDQKLEVYHNKRLFTEVKAYNELNKHLEYLKKITLNLEEDLMIATAKKEIELLAYRIAQRVNFMIDEDLSVENEEALMITDMYNEAKMKEELLF